LAKSSGTNTSYKDKADAAGIITTEKGKKIKRGPTSLHIDLGLWQEVRIMAVLKGKSVTDYVEDALRRKIDADNLEAGKQGYHVGQGGMYIPPPPSPTPTSTSIQQPQQGNGLYELKDEKWTVMDEHRRMSVLRKFIGKIADENKITGIEACKLIMKQKELLKRAADEIGTEDEARLYYWFKNEVDVREQLKEMKEIRERDERQQKTQPTQQPTTESVGNDPPEAIEKLVFQCIEVLATKKPKSGATKHKSLQIQKMFSILKKVIEAVAKEQRVSKEEAIRLIRDRKDLLQRAAKEVGDTEIGTLRMLLPKFEFR
jgi:hypothetical protein